MSLMTLTSREKEILQVLRTIYPYRDRFTLIGGYAVDAYSPLPRYSVDCDVVISKSKLDEFSDLFLQNGFKERSQIYLNKSEGLEAWEFVKLVNADNVSIELHLDGVKCRQTEAIWTETEIKSNASERRVVGVSGSVLSNIVSKELLVTMKLHSGRDADLRDVTMLMESIRWFKVEDFARRGNIQKVIDQLTADLEKIEKPGFEQELKAFFSSKDGQDKRIQRALANVSNLRKKLKESF